MSKQDSKPAFFWFNFSSKNALYIRYLLYLCEAKEAKTFLNFYYL